MKNNTVKLKRGWVSAAIINLILFVLLFLLLYPLAMTVWGSFKDAANFGDTQWYPTLPINLANLGTAFKKLFRPILNTLFVGTVGTLGVLAISSLSAYTFARMNFPGKNFLYMMVMALMMIPGCLTLVPSFMLYKDVIGLNNYAIMIVPMLVGAPVAGVFLLRSFFEGIPEAVFEAARIDGASEFCVYTHICLPLSIPILGTMAINQMTNVWNDYFWPMLTIEDENLLTVPASLFLKYVGSAASMPATYAGYLVASLPLVLLFLFATKYYVEGLSSAAIKM